MRAEPTPTRAGAVERDDQRRAGEAIDELGGDDADDAGVPARAGDDDDAVGLRLGLLHRLDEHALLHGAALDVGRLAGGGARVGVRGVGEQQIERRLGVAEAAGRVEARGQTQRDVGGADARRLRGRRRAPARPGRGAARARRRARPWCTRMRFSSVSGARSAMVPTATRSTSVARIGQRGAAGVAQARAQRGGEIEGDADRGQALEREAAARLVRIDERQRVGIALGHLVVIDDDDVDAAGARARRARRDRWCRSRR